MELSPGEAGFLFSWGLLGSGRDLSGDHHAMRSCSHKTKARDRHIHFQPLGGGTAGPTTPGQECRFSGISQTAADPIPHASPASDVCSVGGVCGGVDLKLQC